MNLRGVHDLDLDPIDVTTGRSSQLAIVIERGAVGPPPPRAAPPDRRRESARARLVPGPGHTYTLSHSASTQIARQALFKALSCGAAAAPFSVYCDSISSRALR